MVKGLYKETNMMHPFICIYSKICILRVSNEYNVHHQESTYITVYAAVCTHHANRD